MQLTGRKRTIFELLCQKRQMTVAALARLLYVSEMTVRRDLAELEAHGFISRYRGGAVARTEGVLPLSERMHLEEEEKRALCERAAAYLSDHITVFVDFSSTCQFLIPHLKKYTGIRLVTNSVQALLTAEALHLPCYLLGGEYCEQDRCSLGTATERAADAINADIAFFSVQGYTEDGRMTDSNLSAITLRERIIRHAHHAIFLFEKAKCGRSYPHTLTPDAGCRLTVLT